MISEFRSSRRLLALGLAFVLAGCGTVSDTASRLNPFNRSDEIRIADGAPPLDQRISILAYERTLQTDPALASQPVRLPTAYVNTVWPQADGYPTHSMQHTQATGPLAISWRRSVGSGSSRDRRLTARPIVAGGRIYTLDANGQVSAMSAQDGSSVWSTRLRGEGRRDRMSFGGGLAYDSGRIFVHAGFQFLVALDATTGTEIWRANSPTPFHTAPTILDGRVFVGTDDNQLLSLSAATGEIQWTYQAIDETARLLTSPSPAAMGDVVIAPFSSGELVALRVQNGNPLWSDSLTREGVTTPISAMNDVAGSPVIVDDQVLAMSHSGLLAAIDMRTGERQWTLPAGGLHAPSVAGDFVFLVTTEGEVICVQRADGAIRWITQLRAFRSARNRRDRIAWSGPILAGGRLFLASSEGEGVVINAADGAIQNRFDLGDAVFVAPIIANETIYVLTDNARLIAIR